MLSLARFAPPVPRTRLLELSPWALAALALVVISLLPNDLLAQIHMGDGSRFGEGPNGQKYFDALIGPKTAISANVCSVGRFARWTLVGIALLYSMWIGYRAAQGEGGSVKKLVAYILVAGIFAKPSSVFGSGAILHIDPVADFISTCGL